MASRSDAWRVALLSLILAAAGCSSDVDIIGRCTFDGDPVLLELPMGMPSVAVVGDRMFVSVSRDTAVIGPSGGIASESFAGWVDADGRLAGAQIDLGAGPYAPIRTQWTPRLDGSVAGLATFDPGRDPSGSHEDALRLWRIDAGGVVTTQSVDLGVASGGSWVPKLGTTTNGVGEDAIWPSVDVGGALFSALVEVYMDGDCQRFEPFLVDEGARAVPVETVDCTSIDAMVLTATGAPTLFDPGDGTIGALVRMGAADDVRLRLIRFRPDATLVAPPRIVGHGDARGTAGGLLARVARVPGNRLIVAERYDGGENNCHGLTVMTRDGSESESAPWQPSCVGKTGFTEGEPRTAWVELVEVPGGAVLIWEEAPYVGLSLTDADTWYERINAVLITPEGKRGSEIVTVTVPQSTVVGPIGPSGTIAQHFVGHADSEGNHVAVAWTDLRADAPGLYARHLRCVVDPAD